MKKSILDPIKIGTMELASALRKEVTRLYEIGDCFEPGNILNAINRGSIVSREV